MRRPHQQGVRGAAWRIMQVVGVGVALFVPTDAAAQGQAAERPDVELPTTLRDAAPIDITGYWVAHGGEDWRYRWIVPAAGEMPGVPASYEGRLVADRWDPEADEAAGLQCKAYGAAGLMRLPGRFHITWEDANTLKIESDSGRQTRRLTWGQPAPPAEERSRQGHSVAVWQTSGPIGQVRSDADGSAAAPGRHGGQLKVVTTHLRPGYLRKNGIPYSEHTVMTEYYTRAVSPAGEEWLIITTIVDDPLYLNEPFITSTNLKREPDGSKWDPTECNTTAPR